MRLLGCGRTFVYEHQAELGGVKIGARLKFRPSALAAYVERQRIGPVAPPVEPARPPSRIVAMKPAGSLNPITKLPWGATAR